MKPRTTAEIRRHVLGSHDTQWWLSHTAPFATLEAFRQLEVEGVIVDTGRTSIGETNYEFAPFEDLPVAVQAEIALIQLESGGR